MSKKIDLKTARQASGLSFRETARRARVSTGALSYYERRMHQPRALARESLAQVVGMDETDIDWTVKQ